MNYQKTERDLIVDFLNHSKSDRLTALTTILRENDIAYEIQDCGESCNNVLVPMTDKDQGYALLVAHHDLYPGSTGINDNTASIAVLINVIKYIKQNNVQTIPFNILFTDREESGMVGSQNFLRDNSSNILFAIVLDIIGYGEKLVSCTLEYKNFFKILDNYGIVSVDTVLPSDNLMFNSFGIVNTLIVATHENDILKGKDYHGNENFRLTDIPKFYESFHNRAMDGKLEVINFDLIKKLRESIIDMLKVV